MRILQALLLCAALAAAQGSRRAPGFALLDTKGQMHDLADYRGKVVVLEFTQTTCPHCASFVEILRKAQQKYGDKVAILAVANPPADSAATINQYVAGHQINYPVMLDCGQMAYSYVLKPNVALPMVYIIDGAGMITGEYAYSVLTRGFFEGNELFTLLDRMVAGAKKK
jgi:peroxiredoxin